MATFVLIHGMFHGGWSWDRLRAALERDGHCVIAPDLVACGADRTPPEQASLRGWTDDVAAVVRQAEGKVVLLGHSRGGMVVSQVAEAVPEKVAAIAYLTALMLPDGKSALDVPTIVAEEGFAVEHPAVQPRPNATGTALLPPENAADLFYEGCTDEDRSWAASQIGHEPIAPLATPIRVTAERWGSIPRIYIETARDRILPLSTQRALIARSQATEVVSLDSDHMPNITHVAELTAMLERIAARYVVPQAVS